jgi:hypothetical protein
MTPDRLAECLGIIRWSPEVLAHAVDVPIQAVKHWLTGEEEIPRKVAPWIEALSFIHESAEMTKPATAGEGFTQSRDDEHIPVYSYNLLRNLTHGRLLLRGLFGTEDEGAVFFLVSRGLATRDGEYLVATDAGRAIGSVNG